MGGLCGFDVYESIEEMCVREFVVVGENWVR